MRRDEVCRPDVLHLWERSRGAPMLVSVGYSRWEAPLQTSWCYSRVNLALARPGSVLRAEMDGRSGHFAPDKMSLPWKLARRALSNLSIKRKVSICVWLCLPQSRSRFFFFIGALNIGQSCNLEKIGVSQYFIKLPWKWSQRLLNPITWGTWASRLLQWSAQSNKGTMYTDYTSVKHQH